MALLPLPVFFIPIKLVFDPKRPPASLLHLFNEIYYSLYFLRRDETETESHIFI